MLAENRKFLIIRNPVSGRRNQNRFEKILALLEKSGCTVSVKVTEYAGHGTELVKRALENGEDWSAIVGAGGDGTIAELANAMEGTNIPLGIIPMGTANVLAREVGIGLGIKKIVAVLTSAKPETIYPGLIGDRRFLLMVSAGYDSLAVAQLRTEEKKKFGAFAYVLAALRASRQFRDLDLSIKIDEKIYKGASIIVSRSRLFGGFFVAAPTADLRKPYFHILILKNKGLWAAIKYGFVLISGRISTCRSVDYIQTDGPVDLLSQMDIPCQIDGDSGPLTPQSISIDEKPIKILAAYR
ncbi:MAG: diacylglycerol kinase family protein [Sneathiella sp.]